MKSVQHTRVIFFFIYLFLNGYGRILPSHKIAISDEWMARVSCRERSRWDWKPNGQTNFTELQSRILSKMVCIFVCTLAIYIKTGAILKQKKNKWRYRGNCIPAKRCTLVFMLFYNNPKFSQQSCRTGWED